MIPKKSVGIMQGRLLPKYNGRYQAHPVGYWFDEFSIARELGLSCIEFIFDYNDYQINPLFEEGGISKIQTVVRETDVKVVSVCADYFMEAPLHSADNDVSTQSRNVLVKLIGNCEALGVKDIVIPCVDQSSLRGIDDNKRFVERISEVAEFAKESGINLSLETDLNPEMFAELLSHLPFKNITVNYDSGNSASLGYNVVEEFQAYGSRISDVHIKDRLLGGGSVILGQGDVNFDLFFDQLAKLEFEGPLIMQAYRDDQGLDIFKDQLTWLRDNYLADR